MSDAVPVRPRSLGTVQAPGDGQPEMRCRLAIAAIAIGLVVAACGADPGGPAGSQETRSIVDANDSAPMTLTSGIPAQREPAVDGDLDCAAGEIEFSMQGIVAPDTIGAPTPEEEIDGFLVAWSDRFGGDVVHVREGVGALVVDGLEVVVASSVPAPAGGWIVLTTLFCESFEL